MMGVGRAFLIAVFMTGMHGMPDRIRAQELEPRAYSNAPVGMNFLLAGYQYSTGALLFDPSLPVTDAESRVKAWLFGYVQTLDIAGKSAKVGVLVPYAGLSADGYVSEVYRERDTTGLADPSFYINLNFYGAPALTFEEFKQYRQETIVGMAVKVTPPLGAYEPDKIINLGTNRWSFKPELGVSRAVGRWNLEAAAAVQLFSDNDDFDNGKTRQQDPIYSLQVHVIHAFKNKVWASISGTYYTGGQTAIDDVANDDALNNVRTGFTLSMPVDRHHSLKVMGSSGVSTRTGTDFDSLGVVWQYRWGGGL